MQSRQGFQHLNPYLLKTAKQDELEENIFDIVNQLNIGAELITHQSKKDELAQLNLIAGKKAKAATAYEAAVTYLNVGLELLALNSWQHQYKLTLALYVETVEAEYLNTQFEQAEKLSAIVLQQAETLLDKVKVYEIKIQSYRSKLQLQSAINTALQGLALLGIVLPQKPSKQDILTERARTELLLRGKQIENLANLPQMTDPYKIAAVRILLAITSPAYITNPPLFILVVLSLVNLCIKYGNSSLAPGGYVLYGSYLCGTVGDINSGYEFGKLSLRLLEKFDSRKLKPLILHVFNCMIKHWKDDAKETMVFLLEGFRCGIENGDLEWGCYAAISYCTCMLITGQNLVYVEHESEKYTNIMIKLKQEYSVCYIQLWRQTVLNLMGRALDKYKLIGEAFNELEALPKFIKIKNYCTLFFAYVAKSMLLYLFKNYTQSVESAILGEKCQKSAAGFMSVTQHNFYYSLGILALYPNANKYEKARFMNKVSSNQKKMKTWAEDAPTNYQHKYELVEAEKARVLGKNVRAMEYYERAIQGARKQGYIQEEAIAYERAAEFYLFIGREEIAQFYMKNAYHSYAHWGATAKVKDLESEYPHFLVTTRTEVKGISTTASTTGSEPEVLDLTTVIKASLALAGEIVVDKLLKKLIRIVIENAGAEKGFLILNKEGKWVIEAEGAVDSDHVTILQSIPVDSVDADRLLPLLSTAIINYVVRTQENVVLNDASQEGQFTRDPYIVATQPKSILCTPLLHQGKLSGILYLENNLTTGAFTPDRVEVLRILSAQAAISIENSRFYEQLENYNRTLEQRVETRTREIQEKNEELGTTLQKLKATQAQIIAQEKLASLGSLTAGIAHEIKNPLNFVNNFAELSVELTQELLEEIENQKDRLDSESIQYIQEILSDLSQNAKKINEHGKRADNIVLRMLMHSRGQSGERQLTDINALLAESLNLAYQGMRGKDSSFKITRETDYDNNLEQMNVVPQDINRVFLNLINNACYAANEKKKEIGEIFSPTVSVKTKDLGERVEIRIRDNGKGISPQALDKIFNPFFTTKPTGEGTGLGLSISHDIIVHQHQGELRVETEVGNYAEFIILLPKAVANNKEF